MSVICDPNQIPQLEGKHIWKQIGSCLVYLLPPPKNSCKLSLLILEAFHLLDPFVGGKASNVCFVPTRPSSHEYSGCISVSNGDERVACLKAHQQAGSSL